MYINYINVCLGNDTVIFIHLSYNSCFICNTLWVGVSF